MYRVGEIMYRDHGISAYKNNAFRIPTASQVTIRWILQTIVSHGSYTAHHFSRRESCSSGTILSTSSDKELYVSF